MPDRVKELSSHIFSYINEEQILANTWRDYDALNVPNSDFPLLCCYRLATAYGRRTTDGRITTLAITYSLTYPQLEQLPDRLKLVADKINEAIISFENVCESFAIKSEIRATYGLRKFDMNNAVYPFLQVTANILDN